MRILHVIPSMGAVHGGPPQAVSAICRAQAELGADITLITTDDNGADRLDMPLGQPIEQDGYRTIYFRRTLRAYTFSWPLTRWLIDHIADYDFLHAHAVFCYPPLVAAFLAFIRRVPYAVTPHGLLLSWGLNRGRTRAKKLSMALWDIPLLDRAAFVHATSDLERRELEALGLKSPIELVLLGWQPAYADTGATIKKLATWPSHKKERVKLLFVGRFHSTKGLDLLFPAVARALEQRDDLILLLAGRGEAEYEEWMCREIERHGIQGSVYWLGFIEGAEKSYAYTHSDIVAVPSYSESFGMVVLEAAGHGVPVIVSDQVAIHAEIAQARAGIVVPCQVEPLAEAITRLASDSNLRREMGNQGVNVVREKFNKKSTASTLLALYEKHVCHV